MTIPEWWIILSGMYIVLSIVWSVAFCAGLYMVYSKTMPLVRETRVQVRRVGDQAKGIAATVSRTADIVHSRTQQVLGGARASGDSMNQSAKVVGAAVSSVLIAARVVNFVRRVF